MMQQASVQKRIVIKTFSNLSLLLSNLLIILMSTRAFSVSLYGSFEYIRSFFDSVIAAFDMKSSTAFYAQLSKNNLNISLIKIYFFYASIIFLLILTSIFIFFYYRLSSYLWPALSINFIVSTMIFCYLIWFKSIILKSLDSIGMTFRAELISISLSVALLLSLGFFFFNELYTFKNFILIQILFQLIIIILWLRIAFMFYLSVIEPIKSDALKETLSSFWFHVRPLVWLTIFSSLILIFDRWILQIVYGPEEQAYFSISLRMGILVLAVCASISTIMLREFSITNESDSKLLALQFKNSMTIVTILSAFLSIFIIFESEALLLLLAGEKFSEARLSFLIMACCPIFQAVSQLNISFLYASNRTKEYSLFSILIIFFGLLLSLILLVPVPQIGLELGSIGLALKFLLINMITAQVFMFINSRFLKIKYLPMLYDQLRIISIFLLIGLLANYLIPSNFNFIPKFFLVGSIYLSISLTFAHLYPNIFGLKKSIFKILKT